MEYIGLVSIAICVISLNAGDICPRYPPSSCHGPFTIRPSSAVNSSASQSCSRDQAVMKRCLKQCMKDLCCRAFGVEDGKCTMVNFHTEAYHFVKEALKWPVSSEVCLDKINSTRCVVAIGHDGGSHFSLNKVFIDAASDLRAIRVAFNSDGFLVRIEVDYGNGFGGSHTSNAEHVSINQDRSCDLRSGEYITDVTGYIASYSSVPVVRGIKFTTTRRICGPYGTVTGEVHTVSGQMLLSVSGKSGSLFDKLEFTFLKC